jgi:hypothetical protein
MCVGEKRILTIPSNLAYGKSYFLSFLSKTRIPLLLFRTIAVSFSITALSCSMNGWLILCSSYWNAYGSIRRPRCRRCHSRQGDPQVRRRVVGHQEPKGRETGALSVNQRFRCTVTSPRWPYTKRRHPAEMNAQAAMYKSSGYAYVTTSKHLNAHQYNNQVMLILKRNPDYLAPTHPIPLTSGLAQKIPASVEKLPPVDGNKSSSRSLGC